MTTFCTIFIVKSVVKCTLSEMPFIIQIKAVKLINEQF